MLTQDIWASNNCLSTPTYQYLPRQVITWEVAARVYYGVIISDRTRNLPTIFDLKDSRTKNESPRPRSPPNGYSM